MSLASLAASLIYAITLSCAGGIQVLEREKEEIVAALGAGDLYRDNPSHARQLQERAAQIETKLAKMIARWEELEQRSA